MKSKYARWGFSHLLTVIMIVVAGSAFAAGETLMHNSNNLGTKYGNWGVAGGKYGEFTCTTCHNSTTNNVKRVGGTLTAPQGNWSSSKGATVSVVFNNMTAFGNDAGGHATSTRICEVCHSKTTVHRYNTAGQADLDHKGANGTDCTSCHSHADAFKGKGCTSCHGASATSGNPIVTGQHTAHIANASVLGQNYGCVDCHAKSVTGDEDIKSAPTAHQNGTFGDFSGARAGNDYAAGSCSTTYCHTDGKGGIPATTVNWATGPALDCKGCHGAGGTYGEPAYVGGNSHATHVSSAADCASCHYATTADGTSIKVGGSHTNRSVEVDGSSSIGFNGGAKTCSTASCHADPYSAGNATTPAWGTSAGCSACHGAFPIGATGPNTGSHTIAGHNAACTSCHAAGTTTTTMPSTGHADGNIDITSGYPANVTKHAAGTYTGTCSTATCHANVYGSGSATTPVWGTTGNGCSACHTVAIGTDGPATGSHAAHTGSLCTDCHAAGTSETTKPSTGHADGDIDVTNGYPVTAKHAAGSYSGTCSTASCHANVYGAGTVTTPVWGVDANCSACHTVAIGVNGPATGSHALHAGSLCTDCHAAGTTATTKPSTGHADGNIDVTNGYPATAKHAAGSYSGTCSTASCHANVYGAGTVATPVWGTTGSGCSACHSVAIGATGPNTGSHSIVGHNVACINCHAAGTTETTKPSTGHADGNIDVANVGYPADKAKGSAAASCSAASCHANVYGTGSATTPVWGSAGNGCSACHTVAIGANGPVTGGHASHAGVACTSCHSAGTTAASAPSTGHNDGNIDVANVNYPANVVKHTAGSGYSSCANFYCHSYGTTTVGPFTAKSVPVWGGTINDCFSCHGSDSTTGLLNNMSTGRHKKHMVGQYSYGCAVCHASTVSNNTTISDASKHVNVQIDVAFSGAATAGGAAASYATTGHAPGAAGTVNDSCSNVYCHSNAQTGGQAGTNYYFRNLTGAKRWAQTGTVGGCSGCHTTSSTTGGKWVLSGAHVAHVNATAQGNPQIGKALVCNDCHANGGTNLNRANHVNAVINYSSALGGSSARGNLKLSTGRCNTVYCHSNGQGVFNNMSTTNWFSGVNLGCNGCHEDAAGAASLSGKHNAHINFATTGGNFGCIACHANTVTSSTALIPSGSNHVNVLKNFSGAKAYKTGFVAGAGTCATYCHTDGKGNSVAPPLWTSASTLDCGGCHGNSEATLATGGHQVHLNKSVECSHCHNATTTNGTQITGAVHTDGTVNLLQGGSFGPKAVEFSYAGANTCNNISCHSPASSGPYVNTATWGPAGSATCDTCHPKTNLSGAHQVHMGALDLTSASVYYNMTANRTPAISDATRTHGFGCAECHPMTTANHLNGAVDVDLNRVGVAGVGSLRFLNASSASYAMGSTKKCSNIYCHSNASRVEAESNVKANTSLAWTDTFAAHPEIDRCAACHGNQPTTGAHAAHAVGNHTDNVYNGKSGKISVSSRANTAHGNPANSTTIGCYICHQATVTSKANDRNVKCVTCHYAGNPVGATLKGSASISNLQNHVNGSREIQFAAIKVLSKAQIRPESFKFYSGVWQRTTYKNMSTLSYDTAKLALDTATMWHASTPMASNCTNIACHNGKTVTWNLANWNDPNKCMDCHNQL